MSAASTDIEIEIKILPHGEGLDLPAYESAQSAGMDIRAALARDENIILAAGKAALIPSGFALALPSGFEAQIRPRSGLAAKHGVSVLNTPGTIDADYRGEVKVILVNFGTQDFIVSRAMRIAQMIIAPVMQARLKRVTALDTTARGDAGFGSTGDGRQR